MVAQTIVCLLGKHADLSSIPKNPSKKKAGMLEHTCGLRVGKAKPGEFLVLREPS